jgi:RNA polymerase sigma-70 factor (ECF subfamily)
MNTVSLEAEERIASEAGSFERFFEAQHARLYGTLCLVTADPREAEDVMQEAFLRLWERWDRVRAHPDPAGYLYRTAFNLHRSQLRRAVRAARRRFVDQESPDQLARVDDRQTLLAGLRRLPRRQRTAVVLLDLMGMTSEEASRLLGVRPVTARVLASQARSRLREAEGDTDE